MKTERHFEDIEAALWGVSEREVDPPSGAAAAFAIVAVMSFAMGLAVAGLVVLF